jgi:L-aminopeptidase/D-esterase-like protein
VQQPNNDQLELIPRTSFDGPALEFDFPELRIGVAEYAEGPTGCTVFAFPRPVACAIDIRGGSPGVFGDYGATQAICLAGGSLYGLEAAAGVAAELFAQADYSTAWDRIALVSGAIVFDFGARTNAIYPDKALGRAALRAARVGVFPLGPRGAGRSVTVGNGFDFNQGERAGQGGAFRQIGETRLAVFTVVNALGAIQDREGRVVRGHLDRSTGERRSSSDDLERMLAAGETSLAPHGNTTLTLVVTNQRLEMRALQQLGRQVHASMARALQPFHTALDGDVFFCVTTHEVANPRLPDIALGVLAAELAWDAVLTSFAPASGAGG